MPCLTVAQATSASRASWSTRSVAKSRLVKSARAPMTANYDIFLSQAYEDAEVIAGASLDLARAPKCVYVGWIEDAQAGRRQVTPATADMLRKRMNHCRLLLFANQGITEFQVDAMGARLLRRTASRSRRHPACRAVRRRQLQMPGVSWLVPGLAAHRFRHRPASGPPDQQERARYSQTGGSTFLVRNQRVRGGHLEPGHVLCHCSTYHATPAALTISCQFVRRSNPRPPLATARCRRQLGRSGTSVGATCRSTRAEPTEALLMAFLR